MRRVKEAGKKEIEKCSVMRKKEGRREWKKPKEDKTRSDPKRFAVFTWMLSMTDNLGRDK